MKLLGFISLVVCAVHAVAAEDVLFSRSTLNKRFIDEQGNYNISFFHINDVHAHLDEFRSTGTDCTNPSAGCFGGYARVQHVVKEARPGLQDSLFLNVGDEFQVYLSKYQMKLEISELIRKRGHSFIASMVVRRLQKP